MEEAMDRPENKPLGYIGAILVKQNDYIKQT